MMAAPKKATPVPKKAVPVVSKKLVTKKAGIKKSPRDQYPT